jgi:hypothetical protein
MRGIGEYGDPRTGALVAAGIAAASVIVAGCGGTTSSGQHPRLAGTCTFGLLIFKNTAYALVPMPSTTSAIGAALAPGDNDGIGELVTIHNTGTGAATVTGVSTSITHEGTVIITQDVTAAMGNLPRLVAPGKSVSAVVRQSYIQHNVFMTYQTMSTSKCSVASIHSSG